MKLHYTLECTICRFFPRFLYHRTTSTKFKETTVKLFLALYQARFPAINQSDILTFY